jgi:hypothetical protein
MNGDIPHFHCHIRRVAELLKVARNVTVKMRNVPILLLLAGCASSPPPRQIPDPQVPPPAPLEFPRATDDTSDRGSSASLRTRGEELADLALQLRGSPYRYGGATRDGFDCSGLVFYAHRQLGVTVPRTSREQARTAREVKERKLQRGDLVFFKIGSRFVNHVGIYIGERHFVHAPGSKSASPPPGATGITRRRSERALALCNMTVQPVMSYSHQDTEYLGLRSATACSVRPLTVYGPLRTLLQRVKRGSAFGGTAVRSFGFFGEHAYQ